jgi:hypothetical protein
MDTKENLTQALNRYHIQILNDRGKYIELENDYEIGSP